MKKKQYLNDYKILKKLKYNLLDIYNQNLYHKALYESCNKDKNKNEDKDILIVTGENRNIFSEIPQELLDRMYEFGNFNENIFDHKEHTISIKNYWNIFEVIDYLLYIIRFDMTKAYVQGDRILIEDKIKNIRKYLNENNYQKTFEKIFENKKTDIDTEKVIEKLISRFHKIMTSALNNNDDKSIIQNNIDLIELINDINEQPEKLKKLRISVHNPTC